jgi:hypothetical protein
MSNQSREVTSSACRANGAGFDKSLADLDKCHSQIEIDTINSFINNNVNYVDDFQKLSATYVDLFHTGEQLFGQMATETQRKDILARNEELKKHRDDLSKKIKANESTTERVNRDFIDTKSEMPETMPTKKLHVLEDYTLAVFITAFIFMVLAGIYLYSYIHAFQGWYILSSSLIGLFIIIMMVFVMFTSF